jgi:hypothetical protein
MAEATHLMHDGEKRTPLLGQGVLDPRWRLRIALAPDEPFRLEPTEAFGQGARADACTGTFELCEAARPLGEIVNEEDRPLGAHDLGSSSDGAGRRLVDGKHRASGHELIVRLVGQIGLRAV